MTILPTVRRQVLAAAQRQAAPSPASDDPRRVWRVARAAGWLVPLMSVVVAGAVILVVALNGPHVRSSPSSRNAAGAGEGLGGVILGPGQAWEVVAIEQQTTPWQPRTVAPSGVPPATTVNASTRAAVIQRTQSYDWVLPSGDARGEAVTIGRPRFIGTPAERALWVAAGRNPMVTQTAGPYTTSANGFEIGTRNVTYEQVKRLPSSPIALRGLFAVKASGLLRAPNQLSEIASTLEWVPLSARVRRGLFFALKGLPGVQDLGRVRDPLGRAGIALGASAPAESVPATGPGSGAGQPLPTRQELVFDPQTKALLADETIILKPSHTAGIGAGYAISWTAYLRALPVRASSVAALSMPCGPDSLRLERGPAVSAQTGEDAHRFELTNQSGSACTLHGYPHIKLEAGGRTMPFTVQDGGPPYTTSQPPAMVMIKPHAHAYFLVAKYRCDGSAKAAANRMLVTGLGTPGPLQIGLPASWPPTLSYCQRYPGDQNPDPGNQISVSPIEATPQATLASGYIPIRRMPRVLGLPVRSARSSIAAAARPIPVEVTVRSTPSHAPGGQVIAQVPAAGTRLNVHTRITLIESRKSSPAQTAGTCQVANLRLTYLTMYQGAFHYSSVYAIKNTGTRSCWLQGFPAVRAYNSGSSGGPFIPAHMQLATTRVRLASGQRAGLVLAAVLNPNPPKGSGPCQGTTTAEVIMPGTTQPIPTPHLSVNVCSRPPAEWFYVSPILPSPHTRTPYS